MATLGFTREDFEVFELEGFSRRMAQLYALVRPKLMRLGGDLAPVLARQLHMEFFPHVAKHARRTVNPPPETWCAFGPSARGYKRYPYLGLCISSAGLHARVTVKSEADHRPEMAELIRAHAEQLTQALRGTPVARYDNWDFRTLPDSGPLRGELCGELGYALSKKTGGIDIGIGWPVREALRLDRAELCEAFAELTPIYRLFRSAT
jgi:uncharacterized protein YktB (UPF0637 family)